METINKLPQLFFLFSHIWKPFLSIFMLIILHRIWVAKRNNGFINWPIFGMLPSYLLVLKTGFHEASTKIFRDNKGTFTLKGPLFCNFEYVGTTDPRNLEHILKTNFYNFRKGVSTYIIMHDFLGDSFFSMDDDVWRSIRKIVHTKLILVNFNKMAMESWAELVQFRLLPIADNFVKQSVVFDLQDLLSRLLFDQNCNIAMGVDAGCLRPSLPVVPFAKAFQKAASVTALRFYFPVFAWKIMKCFSFGSEKEMKKSIEQINKCAYEVIATRKTELSGKTTGQSPRSDFLTLLMETKDENGSSYSDEFFRDNCFNIIFAGAETISVGLTWFFWLLSQNPAVEKCICEEISGIIGKDDTAAMFRAEEVKKMHYLHAAITESLRLYPPVPLNQTEAQEDDEFPNGTKIKKGMRVIVSMYAMGRMESIWGNDCSEFKPERWLRDGKFMPESQYKFPAFNGGLRNCLGKDLAYYEMKVVAAAIIYRYRVNIVKGAPVEPRLSMMLHMRSGLKVTLSSRYDPFMAK